MNRIVSASILSADLCNLEKEIRRAENAGCEYIHFEFSDNGLLPEYVQYIIQNHAKNAVISALKKPTIKYRYSDKKKMLSNIKFILQYT